MGTFRLKNAASYIFASHDRAVTLAHFFCHLFLVLHAAVQLRLHLFLFLLLRASLQLFCYFFNLLGCVALALEHPTQEATSLAFPAAKTEITASCQC